MICYLNATQLEYSRRGYRRIRFRRRTKKKKDFLGHDPAGRAEGTYCATVTQYIDSAVAVPMGGGEVSCIYAHT